MVTIEEQFEAMLEGGDTYTAQDVAIIVTYTDGSHEFMVSNVLHQPDAMIEGVTGCFNRVRQQCNFLLN